MRTNRLKRHECIKALTARTRNVDLAGRIVYNDNNVEVFNFGNTKINQ